MTLREKQSKFVWMIGQLIDFAYKNGYQLTFNEALRSDEQSEINALGSHGRRLLCEVLKKAGYHVLQGS